MKVASINWQDKIDRAQLLSSQQDATGDVLRFYAKVLRFQEEVQSRLDASATQARKLAPFVPEFLDLLAHSGTAQMKELVSSAASLDWSVELDSRWEERDRREYSPLSFIALALLQPYAHHLAQKTEVNDKLLLPHCPFCLCRPQLGVLRPEGEGGKRYLLCSLCGSEWEYRRVICPNCEESDKEKLPVFKSNQVPHVKLSACETCHTYLKCIDLGIEGHAVPEIDDIASLPMSIWMTEHGFRPIKLNLFGF
jgi:FdhE protein